MSKYKLLDLFCGGGGAAKGYHDAGFEVTGVDIEPHPNYPYEFIQNDVLEILKDEKFISQFQAIHASPPCQRFTKLRNLCKDQKRWDEKHPDLIEPARNWLIYYNAKYGIPYIIENVEGAPLINPITLYGSQFGLLTQRPRVFESSVQLTAPKAPRKRLGTGRLGHISETGAVSICGKKPLTGFNEEQTRLYYCIALGGECQWMTLQELTQCIPPAYTKFLGEQIIKHLDSKNKEQKVFNIEKFTVLVKQYL